MKEYYEQKGLNITARHQTMSREICLMTDSFRLSPDKVDWRSIKFYRDLTKFLMKHSQRPVVFTLACLQAVYKAVERLLPPDRRPHGLMIEADFSLGCHFVR